MKRLFLALAATFSMALSFAQSLQDGKKFLYQQRYKSAKEVFAKLLVSNPADVDANYWMGQTLLANDELAAAKAHYAKAIAATNQSPLNVVGVGHVELLEKKNAEARAHFDAAQKLSNFRVVNAFVINDKGQLWIPRRTKTKRIFPLCLDASMGGHVEAGETYEQAFERELHEELGLNANNIHFKMIGKLNPHDHGTSAFMQVYTVHVNQVDSYNTQDFCEYFWLSPQECIEKLNSGDVGKGDLLKIIRQLFL